jgi:hypothetical protein
VRITATEPANPIRRGASATVTGTVTDPGVADAVTCTLEWDDGTGPQPATIAGSGVTRTCSGSHTFAGAGTYTVTMRASDGDGGHGSATALLVVYDPAAGSVAGGGQIDSPAGALRSAPTSAGRATFSAAAAYRPTSSAIPTGTVTWQLTSPTFRFASTTLSWLVVSGPRFQIGGTGEVSGAGSYRFLLTGTDGQRPDGGGVDLARLRVWNPSAGNAVVYDSTLGQAATDDIDNARPSPLRTGNITIF